MSSLRAYGGITGDARRAQRRERLFEAGYDLLAESGPAAVTVTGVCARAGLTSRYFYEHFANREALLDAILDSEARLVTEQIAAAAASAQGGPLQRGEAAVAALLAALERDPRRAQLGRHSTEYDLLLRSRARTAELMTDVFVERAALVWPRAADRPERVRLAATVAVTGVLAMVLEWLRDPASTSRDELITLSAAYTLSTGQLLLDGLARSSAPRESGR
jgi:AcrR family transcriptional regulator